MQKLTVKGRNIVHNNHYRFHYSIQINAQNIQAEVMHGNVDQEKPKKPVRSNMCIQYSCNNEHSF